MDYAEIKKKGGVSMGAVIQLLDRLRGPRT